MSTAVTPRRRVVEGRRGTGEPTTADVLVIFGITGDLAKVMTFRSLYRLERRGLLEPLLGDPPTVHRYEPGTWGPSEAGGLVAGYGGWHGPWVAS